MQTYTTHAPILLFDLLRIIYVAMLSPLQTTKSRGALLKDNDLKTSWREAAVTPFVELTQHLRGGTQVSHENSDNG